MDYAHSLGRSKEINTLCYHRLQRTEIRLNIRADQRWSTASKAKVGLGREVTREENALTTGSVCFGHSQGDTTEFISNTQRLSKGDFHYLSN